MDEKDFLDSSASLNGEEPAEDEVINQTSVGEQEEETFDTTISGIGVNYENNDNWQFEAEARTLSGEFLQKTVDDYDDGEHINNAPAADFQSQPSGGNQIVISKSSLFVVPTVIFVAICVALISVLSVCYFTVPNGKEGKYANPGSVVAQIGETKVTAGMFNYYYSSIVKYYEQYAAYGYCDLNTSEDFNNQNTTNDEGEKVTWAKFFVDEVFEEIERTAAVYDKACDAGITMTAAQQETVDSQIDSMKTAASEAGQSLNQYIESLYGEYCTEDTIRLMLEQYYVSSNYSGYINSQEQPSDEETERYYSEHENEFKQISFSYLALTYDTTSDDSKKESVKQANSYMEKITDRDSIIKMIPTAYAEYIKSDVQQIMSSDSSITEKEAVKQATENYKSTADYQTTVADTPFDDETTKWLFDDNTKIGEKKCYINEEAGYIYVVLKTEKASADETETYSVRHILIMPENDNGDEETSETPKYTDEQWAAAEKKANDILDQYNKGDKNEYSFALLAEANSADVASTSASGTANAFGGLCAATKLGAMVPEFEEWSVNKSRKYGDTGIVKSKYGYHIMFFVNNTQAYKADVISAMREAQVDDIIKAADKKISDKKVAKLTARYTEFKEEQSKKAVKNSSSADNSISLE